MKTGKDLQEQVEKMRAAAEASGLSKGNGSLVASVEPDPEMAQDKAASMAAMRERRWHTIIPSRFLHAQLEDVNSPESVEWAKHPAGRNLVITGPVGAGKSHLAVAAARACHMRGAEVRFFPVVELLDALRPGGPDDIFTALTEIDVLILDDLGAERPTDWTAERLFALVNRRWLEQRPTIATTNLTPADLEAALGQRTISRLVGSDATVVRLAGPDMRLKS